MQPIMQIVVRIFMAGNMTVPGPEIKGLVPRKRRLAG